MEILKANYSRNANGATWASDQQDFSLEMETLAGDINTYVNDYLDRDKLIVDFRNALMGKGLTIDDLVSTILGIRNIEEA